MWKTLIRAFSKRARSCRASRLFVWIIACMGHSIGSERESGQTPRGRQQRAIGVIWWVADTLKQHSVVVEAHGIRMTAVNGTSCMPCLPGCAKKYLTFVILRNTLWAPSRNPNQRPCKCENQTSNMNNNHIHFHNCLVRILCNRGTWMPRPLQWPILD